MKMQNSMEEEEYLISVLYYANKAMESQSKKEKQLGQLFDTMLLSCLSFCKFWLEEVQDNCEIASQFDFELVHFNQLEVQFLFSINFSLWVSQQELSIFKRALLSLLF